MSALDDLKKEWKGNQSVFQPTTAYDKESFNTLIRTKMKKQQNMIFQYFWATFTFHVLVYSLLSHVIIRYGAETSILLLSMAGILVTLPFTVVMMRRYKQLAVAKSFDGTVVSIKAYITRQRELLAGFYTFKKKYEVLLLPAISAIGVILVFNLFFPGGVMAYPVGAFLTFLLFLAACMAAVRAENRQNFVQPLRELENILNDYRS